MAKVSVVAGASPVVASYRNQFWGYQKSGVLAFDYITMNNVGLPRGKLIQFSGRKGSGKTTALLSLCEGFCRAGVSVLYLDTESGLNTEILDSTGLTPYLDTQFFFSNPLTFNECYDVIMQTYEGYGYADDRNKIKAKAVSNAPMVLIIDSVSMLDTEDKRLANRATAETEFYPFLRRITSRKGLITLVVVQTRTKNVGTAQRMNMIEMPQGGKMSEFAPDITLFMKQKASGMISRRRKTAFGVQDVPFATINSLYSLKNRYAPPDVEIPITVVLGRGVSNPFFYLSYFESQKWLSHSGSSYELNAPWLADIGETTIVSKRGVLGIYKEIASRIDKIEAYFEANPFGILPPETTSAVMEEEEEC